MSTTVTPMERDEPSIVSDQRAKMHLDLWMHQNTLAWNRLQVLIAMESAFIAISALVIRLPWFIETAAGCAAAIVAAYLWVVQRGDVQIRDRHKEALSTYHFDPTPPVNQLPNLVPGRGTGGPEKLSHFLIFLAAFCGNIVLACVVVTLHDRTQNLTPTSPVDVRITNFPPSSQQGISTAKIIAQAPPTPALAGTRMPSKVRHLPGH